MVPESHYQSLGEFQDWFNNEREIQKLGYKTPMQIMKERVDSFYITFTPPLGGQFSSHFLEHSPQNS